MKKPISGIIFDYGGVITVPQVKSDIYPFIAKRFGLTEEQIVAGFTKYRLAQDADEITPAEMYRRILADYGITRCVTPALLARLFANDSRSWAHPNPASLTWARELKAEGWKIGILTNMPTAFLDYFEACAHDFRHLADAEIVSGIVRMAKPHKDIFDAMVKAIGIPADKLLFFDDMPRNINGAIAAGYNAHVFTTVTAAKELVANEYTLLPGQAFRRKI